MREESARQGKQDGATHGRFLGFARKEGPQHVVMRDAGQPAEAQVMGEERSCSVAGSQEEEFAASVYKRRPSSRGRPSSLETCGISRQSLRPLRFALLPAALMIDRLRREPDGDLLAQAFFDAMFRHLDLTCAKSACRIWASADASRSWPRGCTDGRWPTARRWPGGPTPLDEVLRRNAYGGNPPDQAETVGRPRGPMSDATPPSSRQRPVPTS